MSLISDYAIRACTVFVLCAGCSSVKTTEDISANNAAVVDDTAVVDDVAVIEGTSTNATVTVNGTFMSTMSQQAQAGVKVCVLDAVPEICTTTDAAGVFSLPVPANSQAGFTGEVETFKSAIYVFTTGEEDLSLSLMIAPSAVTAGLLASIGVTQDPTHGALAIRVVGKGVIPAIDPDDGDAPWYLVGKSVSRSNTGTPAEMTFAGIANIPVGDHTLTLSHETLVCSGQGWTGATSNVQRVPIRAGYLTSLLRADCE